MFIEANPQYKTVNLYDAKMEQVQKQQLGQYLKNGQSQNKEEKQEQKLEVKNDVKKSVKQKPDDFTDVKKKNTRKKGMSV